MLEKNGKFFAISRSNLQAAELLMCYSNVFGKISTASLIILCSVVSSIMPLDRRITGSLAFFIRFNSVQSSGPEVIKLFLIFSRSTIKLFFHFFTLNSVEHEILNDHKYKNIKEFSFFRLR